MRLVLIILSILAIYDTACADKITPTFNNFWYAEDDIDILSSHEDICDPDATNYSYKNKIDNLEQFVNYGYKQFIYRSKQPLPSNCEWSAAKLTYQDSAAPLDFPGTNNDYRKLSDNQKTIFWESDCMRGRELITSHSGHLYPSYSCPKGTMHLIDNELTGCYPIKDNICEGDIVGRDLSTKLPILKSEGHVGMSLGNYIDKNNKEFSSEVIEVLNEEPVIQVNSLRDFMKRSTKYWGAKFKLPNGPSYSREDIESMVETIGAQLVVQPEYTTTWNWWPAHIKTYYIYNTESKSWMPVTGLVQGRFRCDSFVYYLYTEGAHKILSYGSILTPKYLFETFIEYRNLPIIFLMTGIINELNREFSNTAPHDENAIRDIFADSSFDTYKADSALKNYIEDSSIARLNKINFLWELAKKYQDDNDKTVYILDSMSNLHPIVLTNKLIELYKEITSVPIKQKIINLLALSARFDSLEEASAISPDELDNIITIQRFLKDQISDTKSVTNKNTAITQYALTVPPEFSFSNIMTLSASETSAEKYNNEQTYAVLNTSFLKKELQEQYLNKAFNKITTNPDFNNKLCTMIMLLGPENISEGAKRILSTYLLNNKNVIILDNRKLITCDWLLTFATVNSNTYLERSKFINSYLLAIRNPVDLSYLVNNMSYTSSKELEVETKMTLMKKLMTNTRFISLHDNQPETYTVTRAINKLKSHHLE